MINNWYGKNGRGTYSTVPCASLVDDDTLSAVRTDKDVSDALTCLNWQAA